MPNHWHLVLWPRQDGHLSEYMRLVTLTHTQRWHAYNGSAGSGHLYQGRFKSFVVQDDAHFLTVCRYVEANALRAGLVARAEEWRWCSLRRALQPGSREASRIEPWPVERPQGWTEYVNQPQTLSEIEAVRRSAYRGLPYGQPMWARDMAHRLGLDCALRLRGRPKKAQESRTGRKGS
jgi:putative transposase